MEVFTFQEQWTLHHKPSFKSNLMIYFCLMELVLLLSHCESASGECASNSSSNPSFDAENATVILKQLLTSYRKEVIPNTGGEPLSIFVDMYIADMVPIDNLHMHFSSDFFLRLKWRDYRLRYKNLIPDNTPFSFPLDEAILSQIWFPNIYFPYEKRGYTHMVLKDNVLVWIQPDGTVIVSKRLGLTSFCSMDLGFYPFDIQNCLMHIESYSYPRNYLRLYWASSNPVRREDNMHMKDFSQVKITTSNSTVEYSPFGCYDRLTVHFSLYRFLGLFFLRDFFPCILVVILSWVSFWINYRSIPARISLGITTVLTVVTLTNGIRANSPPAGLFRSLDYYLLMCNIYVFAALGEFALVGMTESNWEPSAARGKKTKKKKRKFLGRNNNKGENNKNLRNSVSSRNGIANLGSADLNGSITLDSKKESEVPPISERVISLASGDFPARGVNVQAASEMCAIDGGNEISMTSIPRAGCRGIRFINVETHIIDRISRILFPTTFLLCNAIYFVFHRLHPDTVDS